jgi:carboxyl-terminal processing protease
VEIHPVEQVKHASSKWPIKKITASLIAVILVFSSGVAVGKGSLHPRTVDSNGREMGLPSQLDYSSVNKVYDLIKSNYDGKLDQTKLLEGLKTGLVEATGDPYTSYFTPKEAKEFNDELSGSFTGIGAELGTDKVDKQPTNGMSVDSVVKKIRGPENTKVTLTVVRDNGNPFDVTITRAKITLASVESHIDGNIGYLKVSQFGADTAQLAQKAAQDFKAKGVKAVVLDLRGDPGGYLEAAIDISSLWLDKGKTVVSERKGGVTQNTDFAKGNPILAGMSTAVLIDGGSASASEITAGALHDNGAATLVGSKSFGKGSVQQVINLKDQSELKVTIAHWYTPKGKNIDKQGISPDVEVATSIDQVKAGQDPQKDKAYAILQSKIQ